MLSGFPRTPRRPDRARVVRWGDPVSDPKAGTVFTFLAAARSVSPSRVDVDVRQFSFVIDEPASLGGTDDGPNPVELVLAALLGCMNVLVRQVARENEIEIRGLEMSAEGDLDLARLIGLQVDARAGFAGIHLHLDVDADAPDDDVRRIVQEAWDRSPVGDNLLHRTPLTVAVRPMAIAA